MATKRGGPTEGTPAKLDVRARVEGADAPLSRLVTTGLAAKPAKRDVAVARGLLRAALAAFRSSGRRSTVLVTPAGFIQHGIGGRWTGTSGWDSPQADFDGLASVAEGIAGDLVGAELRSLAEGRVAHLIVGIDVWPDAAGDVQAQVACHVDLATGAVRAVTGKSYPTTEEQRRLVRDPDTRSHVIRLDGERLAILVCHDLAAWSPRGNAVAKEPRQQKWQAMQDAVASARPTLAVHLAHTVDTARTWSPAWSRFEARSGGRLRSATTAICHLDRWWNARPEPPTERLLAHTGRGQRAIDIVVTSNTS